MNRRNPEKARLFIARTGFTLLEMMVAMAVLLMMSAVLISLLGATANIWTRNENQSQLRENARIALDFIGSELRQVVLPLDSSSDDLFLVVNPDGIPASYCRRDSLFWHAAVATSTARQEVAGVGYFVRQNNGEYALCRVLINPENPFYESDPRTWPEAAPADSLNRYQGLFLKNVPGMWVSAYDTGGQPYAPDTRINGRLPARLDVSVVFLDEAGAARIKDGQVQLPDTHLSSNAGEYVKNLPAILKDHAGTAQISVALNDRKGAVAP